MKSIEAIDSTVDGASCFKAVPTKKTILDSSGDDDFGKAMVSADGAELYAEACIDDDTGLMVTCDVYIKSGGFDVEAEGFSATVKAVSFDEKTAYSKFGEPVEFPDVSPPS